MRWKPLFCVGLLSAVSGCNVVSYAGHNIVNDPLMEKNQIKFRHRLRSQAKAVWEAQARNCPNGVYSAAYADGFIDGYADQLNDGGPPLPPGAPPVEYRRHANAFTEQGQARERDYLAGFRHGAEVAAATGIRESTLVELAIPGSSPEPTLNIRCIPAPPTVNLKPMPGMTPPTPMPGPQPGNDPPPIPKAIPAAAPVRQVSGVMAPPTLHVDPPRRSTLPPPPPARGSIQPPAAAPLPTPPLPLGSPPPRLSNREFGDDLLPPWVPPRFARSSSEPTVARYYWAR